MTKSQIIEQISKDKDYHRMALNIGKEYNISKDLFQELMLVLLDYKDETIETLHEKKQLKFFCSRIMSNMFTNEKGVFCKQFKNKTTEYKEYALSQTKDAEVFVPKPIENIMTKSYNELLDNQGEEVVLLRLSIELGGVIDVAKAIGIERSVVHHAIDRAKEKLKKEYGKV